jgi:hypothetical protein
VWLKCHHLRTVTRPSRAGPSPLLPSLPSVELLSRAVYRTVRFIPRPFRHCRLGSVPAWLATTVRNRTTGAGVRKSTIVDQRLTVTIFRTIVYDRTVFMPGILLSTFDSRPSTSLSMPLCRAWSNRGFRASFAIVLGYLCCILWNVHLCPFVVSLSLNPKPIISRPAAGRKPILNRYQSRLFSAVTAYYRLLPPNRDFFPRPADKSDPSSQNGDGHAQLTTDN